MDLLQGKYEKLQEMLQQLGSVVVAFSGGVDSTLLLKVAFDVLGQERVLAVTSSSAFFPERELREAKNFCKTYGIRQIMCEMNPLDMDEIRHNPVNRCYICKRELFGNILKIATDYQMNAVVEGSNMDDDYDYRPGMRAVRELGISSPLHDAQLSKEEIRQLSKMLRLGTWNKPSFACLASRFPYGVTISEEKLRMVERAEQFLLDCGFHQVRVRIHGKDKNFIARIEILPAEFQKLMEQETCTQIYDYLKSVGFAYVTLDLKGYRTGSMNETIGVSDGKSLFPQAGSP